MMSMQIPELPYLGDAMLEQEAVDLLRKHQMLRIPVNPAAVAEAEGLEVFSADFADDVSGILRLEHGVYRIYYNRNHAANRQRFTVAHEIAHYELHREHVSEFVDVELNLFRDEDSSKGETRMEVQANIFAAALLMPEPLLRDQLPAHRSISELADMFLVSRHAMGHRLAGLIRN